MRLTGLALDLHHGLVEIRIKTSSHRLDRLETVLLENPHKFAQSELDTLGQGLRIIVFLGTGMVNSSLEVVDERGKTLKAIKEAGAGNFFLDTEKIEQMLSSFRYRDFVAVGERRGGRFDLTVSKDKCEAILNLAPPFGGTAIEKDA